MNNYYTLKALCGDLRYKISGKEVSEVCSFRKDQADLLFHPPETGKITFCAASSAPALFYDKRAGRPLRNVLSMFPELQGARVADIALQSTSDRIVTMRFEQSEFSLLFLPFGPRPNLLLVRAHTVVASFKDPAGWMGKAAPQPRPAQNVIAPAAGKMRTDETWYGQPLHKRVAAVNPQFPRMLVYDLSDINELEKAGKDELGQRLKPLEQALDLAEHVSVSTSGQLCLLPPDWLAQKPEQSFDSANQAVRTLFLRGDRDRRLGPEKAHWQRVLQRRWSRLQAQSDQSQKEQQLLDRADESEHQAHLLMSQPMAGEPVSQGWVKVSDWAREGEQRTIEIERGRSPAAQAQILYKNASRLRKQAEQAREQRSAIRDDLKHIEELRQELAEIDHPAVLDKWLKKQAHRLDELGLRQGRTQTQGRPYRKLALSGFEIWIGKSAASNDLMLRLAHKEDIWMHARGVAGSHLIVRNQGRAQWPEASLLRQAASWAAHYSKASGSGLAPVIMAKRKHVRKPSGAAAGEVVVSKERVELVEPEKPQSSG